MGSTGEVWGPRCSPGRWFSQHPSSHRDQVLWGGRCIWDRQGGCHGPTLAVGHREDVPKGPSVVCQTHPRLLCPGPDLGCSGINGDSKWELPDLGGRTSVRRAGSAVQEGAWPWLLTLPRASVYPFAQHRDTAQAPDSTGGSDLGCAQRWMCRDTGRKL